MSDHDDFDAFVRSASPALLRTAFLLVGDRHAAEDVLQTALTRCWRHRRRLRDADSPLAYARKVVVNTASSSLRARLRRQEVLGQGGFEIADQTPAHDDYDDTGRLWAAIRRLPPGQRAVIVLRYYDDLSVEMTAEALGCSVGSVKKQAHRAVSSLRATLGEDHCDDADAHVRGSDSHSPARPG